MNKVLVTGASGFIGHHLCRYLRQKDYWVRGVDIKPYPYNEADIKDCYDEYWPDCDMRKLGEAHRATQDVQEVYALAADMGGMGYISSNHVNIMFNNAMINLNTLDAARNKSILYTSSACVYPEDLQMGDEVDLVENDAWLGKPDTGYGIEKLFSEELYQALGDVHIARFHNIFGPEGSWNDGKEKLPAAACRKVAEAKLYGKYDIEVWGDGEQIRSFCYIDDCLEMIYRLMKSNYYKPMNIGTDYSVTVNKVFDTVAEISRITIKKQHDLTKPQGVRARNADLTLMREVLNFEPQITFKDGLSRTYEWIRGQVLWETLA